MSVHNPHNSILQARLQLTRSQKRGRPTHGGDPSGVVSLA